MQVSSLTHEELRKRLSYNSDTGEFERIYPARNNCSKAKVGNLIKSGYVQIKVLGKNYLAHRLAWFYVNGKWPEENLDHINRIKTDNRIDNLRAVPQTLNALNCIRKSITGIRGVYLEKKTGKYSCSIRYLKKKYYIGFFNTIEEAVIARDLKIKSLGKDYLEHLPSPST